MGKPISRQVDEKIERGRPQSGNAEAARQLGLDRDDVRRAVKVVQRMHYLWRWEYRVPSLLVTVFGGITTDVTPLWNKWSE